MATKVLAWMVARGGVDRQNKERCNTDSGQHLASIQIDRLALEELDVSRAALEMAEESMTQMTFV